MSGTKPIDVFAGWIELVTELPVIQAKDGHPTAPRPSVDLEVDAYVAITIPSEESPWSTVQVETKATRPDPDPENQVQQERRQKRVGVLEIEIFGGGAADYERALEMSSGRPDVMRYFDALGDYAIKRPTQISDEPVLRSATREPAAEMAYVVEWIANDDILTEAVEQAKSEADLTEETGEE